MTIFMETPSAMSMEESEARDSCYFPGCRKDANCECEICLASINATLDLMPRSIQKSSLTKLSRSEPSVESTPISFDPMLVSTPSSVSSSISKPPKKKIALKIVKMEKNEMKKTKRGESLKRYAVLKMGLILGLVFGLEFSFSRIMDGFLTPKLTNEVVRNIGERSLAVPDLNEKLNFVEEEFKGFVDGGKISSCSNSDFRWKISQDNLLLNSRCVLYKSVLEEVSIWGWPLQTAGLLQTRFSSSSFTVLTGRFTEWRNGEVGFSIWNANATWTQTKWTSSAVQLDTNTWVLEYSRSSILENPSLCFMALELLKHRMSSVANQEFYHWVKSGSRIEFAKLEAYSRIPT